ncbi:MAG: pyridinium-3,5-biscarboxylic acid mononucleotide synthase [Frankiaceae bacterium]|jgi:NCAIR mutase (PurE)-related protein|nr:pyridinium-3,5-biscarboxylic acid mononucleotide synthase [Frankiaceae bacterium]
MDRSEVRALLDAVATGAMSVATAEASLGTAPLQGFTDLGFARLDSHRGLRTGDAEVVYAAGKTTEQVITLLSALHGQRSGRPALATRLTDEMFAPVRNAFPDCELDETARCVAVGQLPVTTGSVAVVSAGTSDEPVAAEAAFVARTYGAEVHRVRDVGVAGIHRLVADFGVLDTADCLIVVAGMEGALPSVVGGLVGTPLVAVPTSVGYGASFGGVAALLAMLNSCAPGVTVVNIDNGFGAGVFAARVARQSARP